jgi:hypothetical protein
MLEKLPGHVIAFVRFNFGDRMSAIPVPIEPAADCHDSENDQIIVCAEPAKFAEQNHQSFPMLRRMSLASFLDRHLPNRS